MRIVPDPITPEDFEVAQVLRRGKRTRRCARCSCFLSIYNHSTVCAPVRLPNLGPLLVIEPRTMPKGPSPRLRPSPPFSRDTEQAMSQENVEIVRRCYGFWTDRDFSPFSELAHPDVVIDLSRNVFNPGVHRGLDGFRHMAEQVDEMWDSFQIEPEEFIDAGDNVFVASRISGRGRGGGVEAEMRAFAIWTLREGKVSRFRGGYRDRAEALEAAGLEE